MANEVRKPMAKGEPVSTCIGQFAFTYAHEADTEGQYSKGQFKSSLLVEKERNEELKPLKIAILACARKQWGADVKYNTLETPFRDGDEMAEEYDKKQAAIGTDEAKKKIGNYKNFRGKTFFKATSKKAAGIAVVDKATMKPMALPAGEDLQAGDYGYMRVTPHCYERSVEIPKIVDGKRIIEKHEIRGVSLWLNSFLKHRTGERFGRQSDPLEDFAGMAVAPLPLDDKKAGGDTEDFNDADTGSTVSSPSDAAMDDGIF